LLCPVDGTLGEYGIIRDGNLLQAKGLEYRLEDVLQDLREKIFTTEAITSRFTWRPIIITGSTVLPKVRLGNLLMFPEIYGR